MWLIPESLPVSRCAPVSAGSNWDSTPHSEDDCALWVTSSGKPSPRPRSWRGWKTRDWSRHLFGPGTSRTATLPRSVIEWIGSVQASRASRGVPPESAKERATTDGYGRQSSASLGRFGPDGCFSKTSLDLFQEGASDPSSVTFPYSGTMRSGIVSQRETWAPRISASACSSSHSWPTITVGDADSGQTQPNPNRHGGAEHESLRVATASWPTPDTNPDVPGSASHRNLGGEARTWPTPDASADSYRLQGDSQQSKSLEPTARSWPTPSGADGGRASDPGTGREGGASLTEAGGRWPTPNTLDSTDRSYQVANGREYPTTAGAARSFRPDPQIGTCGPECSPKHRRLNPLFVEWLMGLPLSWTDARTGYASSATASYRYRRLLQSELSRIVRAGGFE